jgi:hypothetical protein
MPAKNKKQQRLFGMALALERGKMPKSKASKKVRAISKGMSEKDIEDFAKTKHKGLKENRALSFRQFINEAYIDDRGELADFDFAPDDKYEMEAYSQLEGIIDLLKDAGAESVRHEISGPIMKLYFIYREDPHFMKLNLDTNAAHFSRIYDDQEYTIFDGDGYALFDYIQAEGLDF